MMTTTEIADHNELLASLTAQDGIQRLTWEEHVEAFRAPALAEYATGQLVAAWDSATHGTIGALVDGLYNVTFPDLVGSVCRYPASQLRLWPL